MKIVIDLDRLVHGLFLLRIDRSRIYNIEILKSLQKLTEIATKIKNNFFSFLIYDGSKIKKKQNLIKDIRNGLELDL